MTEQSSLPVIRGKHVLFAMLGLFGLVIAVNLVFVYFALNTFTGVTRENPYQDGLAYNQVLEARHAQRELGWQGEVTLRTDAGGGEQVVLKLSDRTGGALSELDVSGKLRRPTHSGMDQSLTWRSDAPGTYVAEVSLPARGNWDLEVAADDGRSAHFEMKARLWFK